ncbi:flagellar biosynthesis regulator FlaF [Afifella sp. IM 167]|uniref:flagellar biosynthesis regulator FlaF n=1 Tax=Afifella sp. IM 167 TaxID=2033586 RepID=UPI001CCC1493|nr:flagellar biosynthesis regulator FlaF [Afifella sp. IM 167]MBZ8131800.1 flagellar biosynthesis regulator FlhF [Afifella sp. IM 167]
MYTFSYAEILDESGDESRGREQVALDEALELLTVAEARGPRSVEAQDAIRYIQKLWNFLIADLASPQNALADQLRADLISIGIWVIREADRILNDPTRTFQALIEVNRTIRDGLK